MTRWRLKPCNGTSWLQLSLSGSDDIQCRIIDVKISQSNAAQAYTSLIALLPIMSMRIAAIDSPAHRLDVPRLGKHSPSHPPGSSRELGELQPSELF
jgi:hypothetical protein